MSAVTLAELVTPSSQADVLGLELSIATSLGLAITSWQPLDPSRTILQINSYIASQYSDTVALIAQGAYASTASVMVDANGNSITSWMDLRGVDQYNVTRIPATLAAGNVPYTNTSATTYNYSANAPLHFQNATTGATYTSVGTGTVAGGTSGNIPVTADAAYIGGAGTSGSGVTLVLLIPLAGVTITALTTSLIGNNAETNASYYSRCVAKLGTLSPNGSALAYQFIAESVPVFGETLPDGTFFTAPTANDPYGVTVPVDRVQTVLQIGSGIIDVWVANASGGVAGCVQLGITNVTWLTGTVTVTTTSAHNLSPGAFVIISGVNGATGVNNSVAGTPAWLCIAGTAGSTIQFSLASSPGLYTSGGSVEGGDLGMVDAAIQAQCVPNGQVSLVMAATNVAINVTYTVYYPGKNGITSATIISNIETALANYFASVPIGGVTAEATNIVPWTEILTTVANANTGTVSVVPSTPLADVVLTNGEVPISGTINITVVFV